MSKLRLLFIKEGPAAYISHLDLLRTVQRAFPRTELDIKHSNGYHPHPIISIVLPLPEGMPEGLRVLACYEAKRPVRELAALQAEVTFEYDNGVPENAAAKLKELFGREELIIQKRTKRKDMADVNIAPMILRAEWTEGESCLRCVALVQAQNPGLNPQLMEKAVERYAPELTPDFVRVRRMELLDAEGKIFR